MIHVFVTLFNNGHLLPRCVESIARQSTPFKCYVIDDCSTDDSAYVAESLAFPDSRFMVIRNDRKLYQSGCYDLLVNEMNIADEDICVAVDSDDFLIGDALTEVRKKYNEGCWVTHGSYTHPDGSYGYQLEPPYDVSRLRSYNGVPSHLRTWKAFLWRRIPQDRIRTPQGEYWKAGGDLAFMYSMMEMANDKVGFINKSIYCYDNSQPTCNHVKNPGLQKHNDFIIRNQKPLHPKLF
jgi:glycosyltransferase involved in cell wall biosynthesis